jgi:tetratricopeptide (TPR) repeat protein
VLEKRPNSYRALLDLGYLARSRGDQAAALEYFEAARAAQPHKRRPKLEAARELRKLSRLDEAEALYRSVLEQEPTHVRALVNLGRIARARGNVRLGARARVRKLATARASGLPPFERSWLERDTFARAGEWGRNLEALGIPAFGMSVLTLAQDFAYGVSEEVKPDCILLRRGDKTKILPLVSEWNEFDSILKREAAALPRGHLLGYVPEERTHREFVYHRASVADLVGSSLSTYRRQVRLLLKAGAHVEPISPANLDRVLACNDRWFARKKQTGRKTYYRGRTLWTFENLSALEALGLRHLAVILDDDVVGYAVASHIGAAWAVFTFHRGDREPWGVAPYLLSEMARLFPDREWINDGPAVRKPGLAFFKERFASNAGEKQMKLGWMKV